jgi:dTDP-4-dehydrorhamnose 3,5-epimerase
VEFEPTRLPEVILIRPRLLGDPRGFLFEAWHEERFRQAGIVARFVQENHSQSVRDTVRGLHFQLKQPQGKLVRVTHGEVFDVVVDVRRSSPRFGQWVGIVLSETNHTLLWVPPGFAHGYMALTERIDFVYKCTDYYAPQHERAIRWDDPHIGVQWPVPAGGAPILSPKDAGAPSLKDADTFP